MRLVSLEAADVALRSVGTALTLSSAGFYLHSRGFISDESKQAFGRYIQQVSMPAFFFTKLVECPAHYSPGDSQAICPSILDHLSEAWILLIWPLYVIGCGIVVGHVIAWLTRAPKQQYSTIMLGTAFGNSGSLPTTLLLVLHQHSVSRIEVSSSNSHVDPNAFLSLYLILHPIMLWSLGSWLAEPPRRQSNAVGMSRINSGDLSDTGLQVLSESLTGNSSTERTDDRCDSLPQLDAYEQSRLLAAASSIPGPSGTKTRWSSISLVFSKACQPPVIGSLLGIIVTVVTPIRQVLVQKNGPLDWWFDGLLKIGTSSIPVSMAVLGMNLSSSLQKSSRQDGADTNPQQHSESLFGWKTMVGVILGKLVILPIIGFASFAVMRSYFNMGLDSPSLAMVLLIVWITPTANNAVVVADLAGGLKEAMAQLLAWEYLVVPAILSVSVACVIRVSGLAVD
ncbi:hypothetical protein ACA910_022442 [Epithemia clementina (nom. ined.)]